MKFLPVLLGVSLAANAALVVFGLSGGGLSESFPGGVAASGRAGAAGGGGEAGVTRRAEPATGQGRAIAAALNGGDTEALRDELRAAGVDEDLIRTVVGTRIWKRYEDRMRALQTGSAADQPWWKNDDSFWSTQHREQREAMKALQAEIKAERERVLGPDPEAKPGGAPWLERHYGFLPAAKREALQQMEQDYNELAQDLRREAKGFSMPEDAEKARFLEAEKRRDLAAMLSPEELADYDLRQSRTAQNLRWQMTRMDATEVEYRAIFEIRKDFDEQFADRDAYGNLIRPRDQADGGKARQEAEKAMQAQLKNALGPDRYRAYVRSNDQDYQQLQNATKRFGLPPDTPARLFDLRDEVPRAALRVADDANLTPAQKRAELNKLVAETRDRVRGTLGPDVAKVYFDHNGMQWLRQLESGMIIIYDENGGQQHRQVEQASKPKAAASPKN
jgi:hypothetical protein